jgi:transglutaminase/protease-like cytokinesis protein 3
MKKYSPSPNVKTPVVKPVGFFKTGNFSTFKNGTKFTVQSNMNCKTENVIYCMICEMCGENYIGQTGNKIADRVRVYKQQIRVAHHINFLFLFNGSY